MDHITEHPKIKILLSKTDEFIEKIGFTEHGTRHAKLVSDRTMQVLVSLGFPEREQKLGQIAGYLHDVGNAINRTNHAQSGAVMVFEILHELNFKMEDIMDICGSIGNHHEDEGRPISPIAAALIIADKTDVHRSRVRNGADIKMDIHDRVNYAATDSRLVIDGKTISSQLKVDTQISPVMEYFEIFIDRMIMAQKAADFLGCKFELVINDTKIL